jgi:hypothetical protein
MKRPLSTVASMPSDRTLPPGLRTARLATVLRLLKSGAPSQTHRRSRSVASFLVARTVVSGTRTCCQLSPRKTANEKKPTKLDEHLMYIIQEDVFCLHSVNVRGLKDRQRGSVCCCVAGVVVFVWLGCAAATAHFVILYVAAFTLLWCAFFFLECRCLRSFFSCFFVVRTCGKLGCFYRK